MKKSKDEKGISLLSLIITVIIMSILVGVSTYYGIESYKQAQVKQFVVQMQLIQTRVDELVELNEYQNLGSDASSYSVILSNANKSDGVSNNINDYKYFSKENLKNQFDIDNIDDGVLINFSTREVVSIVGIEYEGKTYYTQYKLPEGQALIQYTQQQAGAVTYNYVVKNEGLNSTIIISNCTPNSKLTYAYDSGGVLDYQTVCDYTGIDEKYYINITKSGQYFVSLRDNNNNMNFSLQTINIALVNSPKTELEYDDYDYTDLSSTDNWARVSNSPGEYYVWVPRFAVNNNTGDIKFIKGNTNIATDDTYINNSEWTIPSQFTKGEAKYTGLWFDDNEISSIDDVINDSSLTGERIIQEN